MADNIHQVQTHLSTRVHNARNADQNSGDLVLSIRSDPEITSAIRRRSNVAHVTNLQEAENNGTTPGQDLTRTLSISADSQASTSSPTFWRLRRLLSNLALIFSSKKRAEASQSFDEAHGYNTFIKEDYRKLPKGFPRLASFVASEPDFSIYRSFKTLHERLILHLMVEITDLEEKLKALDQTDANDEHTSIRLRELDDPEGEDSAKKILMDKITRKLDEYDKRVLNLCNIRALGPAAPRQRLSYFNWMAFHRPLKSPDDEFIRHQDDFVTGVGDHSNYFQEAIKNCLYFHPNRVLKWLAGHRNEEGGAQGSVDHFSDTATEHVRTALSMSLAVVFLLVPVFLLFLVHMTRVQMVFTAAMFIVPFGWILSYIGAKDTEVFVGTATYAALLMVFLGNIGGGASCTCPV